MERLKFILHDLDYVSNYKEYEKERQDNEEIRCKNENERIDNEEKRSNQDDKRRLEYNEITEKIREQTASLQLLEEEMRRKVEEGDLRGEKGDRGEKGEKGDSPVKGVDYWTEEDKQEIQNEFKEYVNTIVGNQLDMINGEEV